VGFAVTVRARDAVPVALAAADIAAVGLLALTARAWLPPDAVGDSANWIAIGVINAIFMAVWQVAGRRFWAVLAGLAMATLAGAFGVVPAVVTSTFLLLALGSMFRLAMTRLRGTARDADARLAETSARRTAEQVAAQRTADRREHDRLIHDTVLNTLTGIALGGGGDRATSAERCAAAVDVLVGDRLLAEIGHPTGGFGDLGDPGGFGDLGAPADIRAGLAAAVAAARGRGLRVEVDVRMDGPQSGPESGAGGGPGRGPGGGPDSGSEAGHEAGHELPGEVVAALAGGVGQALENARRHAGTGRAILTGTVSADRVRLVVRDWGVGFDPGAVDEARLGLRGSIIGRVSDVGGWVEVASRPGAGTAVTFNWRAPEPDPALAEAASALRAAYDRGIRRAVATLAGGWLALMLIPAGASLGYVRRPAAAAAIWLVMAAGLAGLVPAARRRPLRRAEAGALALLALGSVAAGGFNVASGADTVRFMDWPTTLMAPVLVALLGVSRPLVEWLAVTALCGASAVALTVERGGTGPLVLSRLVATLYGLVILQVICAQFGPVLRASAEATARAAEDETALAAAAQAAAAIRSDRRAGLSRFSGDALPLLAAIANGECDPAARETQVSARARAAGLRRVLAASGQRAAFLGELELGVRAAEEDGLVVDLQLSGEVERMPVAVRDAVMACLADVLGRRAAAPGGQVVVTVMCEPAGGSASITYPPAEGASPPAAADPLTVFVDDDLVCVEGSWTGSPAPSESASAAGTAAGTAPGAGPSRVPAAVGRAG
jgi:signal transduction histidine kinase